MFSFFIFEFNVVREEALAVADGAGGLEIGGPSGRFRQNGTFCSIQRCAASTTSTTLLRPCGGEALKEGAPYVPAGRPTGVQFLREATDLLGIPQGT